MTFLIGKMFYGPGPSDGPSNDTIFGGLKLNRKVSLKAHLNRGCFTPHFDLLSRSNGDLLNREDVLRPWSPSDGPSKGTIFGGLKLNRKAIFGYTAL